MVTGQKVRWVLDLMRGTEFAGRTITSYDDHRARTRVHEIVLQEAGPGRRALATSPSCASRSSTLGDARRDRAACACSRAAAPRAVRHRRGRRLRLVVLLRRSTATHRGGAVTASRRVARQRAPPGRDRRRHGHLRDRPPTACASPGLGRLVDDGDGGDTYNYSPPDDDRVVDTPDAVRVDRARTGPGASAGADRHRLHLAGVTRSATTARARARSDETVRGHRAHDARAARGRTLPARHPRARQPGPRPSAPRALPAAGDRSTGSDAECAFTVVHRGLTAEGGVAGVRAADVPVAPVRRRVRRHRRARARARRPARIRGRRRRPRARAHAAPRRSAISRAPSRRCARTPRARPSRSHGAQMLGAATRRVRGAAAPRRLARRRLLRRGRRVPRPVRAARVRPATARTARDAAPRCASTAPRCRRCCAHRAGSSCACSAPSRRGPGDDRARRHAPPAAGSSTSAAGRVDRSKARSTLRPWEICHPPTDVSLELRLKQPILASAQVRALGLSAGVGTARPGRRSRAGCNWPAGTKP